MYLLTLSTCCWNEVKTNLVTAGMSTDRAVRWNVPSFVLYDLYRIINSDWSCNSAPLVSFLWHCSKVSWSKIWPANECVLFGEVAPRAAVAYVSCFCASGWYGECRDGIAAGLNAVYAGLWSASWRLLTECWVDSCPASEDASDATWPSATLSCACQEPTDDIGGHPAPIYTC